MPKFLIMNKDLSREQFLERPLPSAPDAEKALIAYCLLDKDAFVLIKANALDAGDFYSRFHRQVFEAFESLFYAGKPLNPIFVLEFFKSKGYPDSNVLGDIAGILYGRVYFGNKSEVTVFVDLLKAKSLARNAIKAVNRAVNELLDEEETPAESLDRLTAELSVLKEKRGGSKVVMLKAASAKFSALMENWRNPDYKVEGFNFGIPEIDANLGMKVLALQDFSVIGARPRNGKSALCLQVALNNAYNKKPVLFFSREMPDIRLVKRMLARFTDIPNKEINPFFVGNNSEYYHKLTKALEKIKDLPFAIETHSGNIDEIYSTAYQFTKHHGPSLIIADYFQLIEGDKKAGTRDIELGGVSRKFKKLAMETNSHLLVPAQLKSTVEDGIEPSLDTLRETGNLKQDVDNAFFIWINKDSKKEIERFTDLNRKAPAQIDVVFSCKKQREGDEFWQGLCFEKDKQVFMSSSMYLQ